jgi:uncharacterized protein (DUF885 family)
MNRILLVCAGLVFLWACSTVDENARFVRLADNFIEKFLEINPEWATSLGDHRYDDRMGDYSLAGIEQETQLIQTYLDSLNMIPVDALDQTNRIDYQILKMNLESMIYARTELKAYEWNPLYYNVGGAIYSLLARDFAPLSTRLDNVRQRLLAVPGILDAARSNLKNPPKVHTETAIIQNSGNISLLTGELNDFIDQAPESREMLVPVRDKVVEELEAYGQWLEKELLPRSDGEFRLGEEKFRKKLYYTLESDLSKETILARATEELEKTQKELYETASLLYAKYFPGKAVPGPDDKKAAIKTVLDRLAEDHPNNVTIVPLAKEKLAQCTEFVQVKDLVTVPDEPIRIIVMPEFQRGVAVAYCDAPGALEENGETFYAISPTPEDWNAGRVLSFFREYNNYMLDDLTIHEAMPGHYLQLMHSNAFKAPTMIRAIFASGTFIEGWATYSEQLMVEAGYGGPELKMQQLKMRLRLIINAIIDQKIHTEGMTEEAAMTMMMEDGFQEEGEAAGKWRRACLTSTQLSTYFVGNLEVNEIRHRYEEKFGPEVNMKEMHDRMLSFGSPAPKFVMEMLQL